LSQVFEEDGVLPILDELFSRAVDLQTASQEDCVGIELVKIILLTIPYLLASTSDQSLRQKAAELLEKTDIVASTPHALESLVEPCSEVADEREKPMIYPSTISILQRQLQDEAANSWPLACILQVYDPSYKSRVGTNLNTNGESNGETSSKLSFPSITVPSPINPGPKALFPELFFSMFADHEVESVPPTSNIASTLMRDVCVDTINILDFNRSKVAQFLYSLDNFWPQNLFAPRKTLFDTLRTMEPGQPTWKPEDVAVDSVFSQLLLLPYPEHKVVYYHSIITELCMFDSGAIAPTLGRVIRPLFRNMDILDLELGFRFMEWFAQQLSNFEWRWKWIEW
jgi:nuclear cap-binding protein subunit 1